MRTVRDDNETNDLLEATDFVQRRKDGRRFNVRSSYLTFKFKKAVGQ